MRLTHDVAFDRLAAHDHGILGTLHPARGVDLVPVVYAVDGDRLAVPIDRVKPKASMRLQRERNLEDDPRATLLAEQWDRDDWSQLWWVRAELRWKPSPPPGATSALTALLVDRYPQYRDEPFERVLVFTIVALTGWSART